MKIAALAFDTYGTVVDWRGSALVELRAFGAAVGRTLDWERFLDDWKSCYRAGMDRVNSGEWPWTTVETIYRRRLDELLARHGLDGADAGAIDRLSRVWWRLRPWPDSVPGLTRLRTRYVITPLSNASFAGMLHLAKFAGLPWDCIITAQNARCYKPRPEVYRTAVELLGLAPGEVMMVAAHNYDLRAARACGLRTAFVPRPSELGPGQTTDLAAEEDWDICARDLEDLAGLLGA
ncbi:MAG TPA: haloacid dehalogenase type II [Candidatus Methylomirabilis sp.]|nr:haloacid dehalogenase type II [Candidatus Methylomirabilis sp.]